jgi:Fe-S-cluster containining protein
MLAVRDGMIDGIAKSLLKRLVAWLWRVELAVGRRLAPRRWELSGSCNGCGACCVEPSICVGVLTWRLPTLRRLFLFWQRHVNGFELLRVERETRTFVFRCAHYQADTRRCDSYRRRPAMCRDYPRVHLDSAWPDLFDGCGYSVRSLNAGLREQIDATGLSAESKAELKKKLRLD